jgi:hypothetical protein
MKTLQDPLRTWLNRMRRMVTLAPRHDQASSRWVPECALGTQMEFEFARAEPCDWSTDEFSTMRPR